MTRSLGVGGRTPLRGSARHRPSSQAQPQGIRRPGMQVTKSRQAWEGSLGEREEHTLHISLRGMILLPPRR